MRLVFNGLTLLWIVIRYTRRAAAARAWVAFFLVSACCSWLRSRIDAVPSCFGGSDQGTLFIASGTAPAIFGAFLYRWLLCAGPDHPRGRPNLPDRPPGFSVRTAQTAPCASLPGGHPWQSDLYFPFGDGPVRLHEGQDCHDLTVRQNAVESRHVAFIAGYDSPDP